MSQTNSAYLTVVNPDVKTDPKSVIYQGVSASLTMTLTNNSSGPVKLTAGAGDKAAHFRLFFPLYFAADEVAKIQLSPPQGWTWRYDPKLTAFVVTYAGEDDGEWKNGGTLAVGCAGVLTKAQPTAGGCQANLFNMPGNIPSQLPGQLDLMPQKQPGRPELTTTLRATLQAQGTVYVSSSDLDPLPNQLFLTLTNFGPAALFTGAGPWKTSPTVTVSFLYGSAPGSLAPRDGNNVGSVLNITPSISISQGNKWTAVGPTTDGDPNFPVWKLAPSDLDILPSGAGGSITFAFSNIVSITDPGHTQMTVRCSNFPVNDTQTYEDCVFVLDVVKQVAPPTRGLLNFYGSTAVASVTGPREPVNLTLHWSMLFVDSAVLVSSFPGVNKQTFPYTSAGSGPPSLNYDSTSVTIPGVAVSTPVFFTLQTFDSKGGFLNALQYAVWVNSGSFIDPRDQQIYPTVLVNGLYWMAANLDWKAPGSEPYENSPTNETTYGRLYPYTPSSQSLPPPPPGPPTPPWRLPTLQDWQALIAAAGQNPYAALMPRGTTGFNALLGGRGDNLGGFTDLAQNGWYWTSDAAGGMASVCQFNSAGASVNLVNQLPESYLAAVRYVRNA